MFLFKRNHSDINEEDSSSTNYAIKNYPEVDDYKSKEQNKASKLKQKNN